MSKKTEQKIQQAICDYLDLKYPDVIYRSDGAGLKLTIGQAKQFARMQSCRAYPDLFIAEPRGGYHGLFIEIKSSYYDLYTKKGWFRKSAHITEQNEMLQILRSKGYSADFGLGLNPTIRRIDLYMALDR